MDKILKDISNLENNCNNLIEVSKINGSKGILKMYKKENGIWNLLIETEASIGRNGITSNKKEGDGKTPEGIFKLGIAFGLHDLTNLNVKYIKLNENLYWIDDINSKYYNQMVDITKVKQDWKSAEHLIDYKVQYEYAIKIKTNPKNIPGKGSAIFLHCTSRKTNSWMYCN